MDGRVGALVQPAGPVISLLSVAAKCSDSEMADQREGVLAAFQSFSQSADGTISREDLAAVLKSLAPETWTDDSIASMLDEADVDRGGRVDFEEFVAWVWGRRSGRAPDRVGSTRGPDRSGNGSGGVGAGGGAGGEEPPATRATVPAPADGAEAKAPMIDSNIDVDAPAKLNGDAAPPPQEECPICCEMRADVEQLVHYKGASATTSTTGHDVSSHRACGSCRAQMVEKNQSCPWCRDPVEWQDIFGFLNGFKGAVWQAREPDDLADLMATWQEYEMTRSQADVRVFARDMVEDVTLCAHLDRMIAGGHTDVVRDSAGLWCRFHAMVADGELELKTQQDAERLKNLVDRALEAFEEDGGGAPEYMGAMYTQVAVALLCAQISGSSTKTLAQLTRRVGEASVRLHQELFNSARGVRETLVQEYASSVTELVWGSMENDIVLQTFFGPGSEEEDEDDWDEGQEEEQE